MCSRILIFCFDFGKLKEFILIFTVIWIQMHKSYPKLKYLDIICSKYCKKGIKYYFLNNLFTKWVIIVPKESIFSVHLNLDSFAHFLPFSHTFLSYLVYGEFVHAISNRYCMLGNMGARESGF